MKRIAGVHITLDDGFVLTYKFATQRNRNRFSSLLRFYKLSDEQVTEILRMYDEYFKR